MTKSQRIWVEDRLKETNMIGRNHCLQNYITRLAAIIKDLRNDGWEFTTERVKGDYVYKVVRNPYKKVIYHVPGLNKTIVKYEKEKEL